MRFASLVLAGCLMVAPVLSPQALAQIDSRDAITLQNQILDLRQQMQALQQQRGGPAPSYRPDRGGGGGDQGGLTAQLLDRVSTLEDQVRSLRGQVDQLTNAQQRQAEDFNKQIGDLKFAMQTSGPAARASQVPPAMSPPPSSLGDGGGFSGGSQVPAGPVPRTPELAMQEANAALARRDYSAAEAAAREVIGKRSPRAPDAQFVLAQAEMGERNYQQAAPDYYDAYNRNRTGPRAPDALLGVAAALTGLGDKTSACDALTKLHAEFPQPRPDIRDGMNAVRARAGCR